MTGENAPVPADRSEFATFSDHRVKVTQGKENGLEFVLFRTTFHGILIEVIQRLVDIRVHP